MSASTGSSRSVLRLALFIAAVLLATAVGGGARASSGYHLELDTTPLGGQTGQLAFSFIDGDGVSPNNSAAITSFVSGGTPGAITLVQGLASGNLSSGIALQDTASTLFIEAFTFGTTLSFDLSSSEQYQPPLFPDQLAFFVLSDDLSAFLVTTTDSSGANALFTLDVDGGPGGALSVYDAFIAAAPIRVTVSSGPLPEPGSLSLMVAGALALLMRLRASKGERTCTAH